MPASLTLQEAASLHHGVGMARQASAGLDCEVLTSLESVLGIEEAWRSLEPDNPGACFFQSFAWCRNFLMHAREHGRLDARIQVVRQGSEIVAILPLAMQTSKGSKVLTGLSEPFQQYSDMLLAPAMDAKAAFAVMMQAIHRCAPDYLHLGQVRRDSNLYKGLQGVVPASGEEDSAPFVRIGDFASFEAYQQSINAKTRKNMRNAKNRLERDAAVGHSVARTGKVLEAVIDRSFEGREAWLERQGLTSRAFRDSGFRQFLDRCKNPGQIGIDVIAFSLTHGGKPIADQWGFVHNGRYYAFMAGWDESYGEASPGKMHLGAILAACHEQGIAIADFMIPGTRYKFTWTDDATLVQDHVLALTLRGFVHNSLWLNFLRPLAKRVVFALPKRLRARLVALVVSGKG